MSPSLVPRLVWALVLLAACGLAAATGEKKYSFDIPRTSLTLALQAIYKQTQLAVGRRTNDDPDVGPLRGVYTLQDALTQLLYGTGLGIVLTDNGVLAVVATQEREPPRTTTQLPPTDGHDPSDTIEERSPTLGGVTVAGTHIYDAASPTTIAVFDQVSIARLGASTLSDVLRSLSQQAHVMSDNTGGRQYVDLRGFGPDTTLVLIDGRTVWPMAGSALFDPNTIPVAAIQRIEVLSGAHAPLGANAPGGIVNIVMKTEVPRPVVEVRYGTARGGADEKQASLGLGHIGDELVLAFVAEFFDRGSLQGCERDRWRNQDYRRYGSVDQRSPEDNIRSVNGENLPGLSSSVAAVPPAGGSAPGDFEATAGVRNVASAFCDLSIVPTARRISAFGSLEWDVLQDLTAFGSVFYADRETAFDLGSPLLSNVLIPASNAHNPFGVPVRSDFLMSGIDSRRTNLEMSLLRMVAGVKRSWDSAEGELSALHSTEDGTLWTANLLDPVRLIEALAATDPDRALNVFGGGAGGDAALLASLLAAPNIRRYLSSGTELAASLHGPLLRREEEEDNVVGSIGARWRREVISFHEQTAGTLNRVVAAGFAEVSVPLWRKLKVRVAGRVDRYSDWGSVFNPRYEVAWSPTKPLRFTVSYATSFRSPSMYELAGPRDALAGQVADPRRGYEISNVVVVSGGNPDLEPTTAKSWNAGILWKPEKLPNLEIALDYWRIGMDDRVATMPVAQLLVREALYGDRILRADPTAADIAAGRPGALRLVDDSLTDFGRLRTRGIDFKIEHAGETRFGHFRSKLTATWVDQFATADFVGMPFTDRVDVASMLGTVTKWRGGAELEWSRSPTTVFLQMRYIGAYDDVNLSGRNGRVVPAQLTVDLDGTLALAGMFQSPLLQDLKLRVGILNLFNEAPPFAEVGAAAGFDPSQGDLKGRFGYVAISKTF